MSGGHWDYGHYKVSNSIEDVVADEEAQRRWPKVCAALETLGREICGVIRRMDYDLSGDSIIEDDAMFDEDWSKKLLHGAADGLLTAVEAKTVAEGLRRVMGAPVPSGGRSGFRIPVCDLEALCRRLEGVTDGPGREYLVRVRCGSRKDLPRCTYAFPSASMALRFAQQCDRMGWEVDAGDLFPQKRDSKLLGKGTHGEDKEQEGSP